MKKNVKKPLRLETRIVRILVAVSADAAVAGGLRASGVTCPTHQISACDVTCDSVDVACPHT